MVTCSLSPDAQAAAGDKLKMIYGVEMNMIDTNFDCVFNANGLKLNDLTYVSFDLETTGLSQIDDYITEIGAVKIKKWFRGLEDYRHLLNLLNLFQEDY